VTLTNIDPDADEIDLLLKVQGNGWQDGCIEVWYQPRRGTVKVMTYTPGRRGWVQQGADLPVTFQNGDVLGAKARADGSVEVYKNGALVGSRDARSWAFTGRGGKVGLWTINGTGVLLDDFAGGNLV